jgi:hypothetical protein
MEARLGHDFAAVRIHTDAEAGRSAGAVEALAYTVGRDVVFGAGRYRPETAAGRALIAHELTHVVQQGGRSWTVGSPLQIDPAHSALEREAVDAQKLTRGRTLAGKRNGAPSLARATADQVDCAPGPLTVPGPPPLTIADPVGVITAAETTAHRWLDEIIGEIEHTQTRIAAGAPLAWPTISDALFVSLRIIGINPTTPASWKGAKSSVGAVLANLRPLRDGVVATTLRYRCLGPQQGTIGACSGAICSIGEAATCEGAREIVLCTEFWQHTDVSDQAATLIHENVHRVLLIPGHGGRRFNPECFARMVQFYAGVTAPRTDLCPAIPEETP